MYVILGALGQQGEAILHYLYQHLIGIDVGIVAIDRHPNIDNTINSYMFKDDCKYNVRYMQCELPPDRPAIGYDYFDRIREENVTVVNCLPTEYILGIVEECFLRHWNVIDLGGVTAVTSKLVELDADAKDEGIRIVTDCGLAPGIASSKIAEIAATDDAIKNIKVYCGGFPKYPEPPLFYSKVFYLDGVRKEYSGVAREKENGRIRNYPALSGREYVPVPGLGVLEAARTSGGISLTVDSINVPNLSYKTLRYPGHWDYVKEHIMSQENPTAILEQMLEPVSPDNPDMVVLSFHTEYADGDTMFDEYFWEYDYEHKISAMAQATGYVAGAVARKVHDGETRTGVIGMHEISASEVIEDIISMVPNQFLEAPLIF